jgi:protein required for attachment to host cells
MRLTRGAWVIVLNGGKRLILENHGEKGSLDLQVRDHWQAKTPRTSDVGAARPGRYPGPGARREAVEETDFHRQGQEAFVAAAAAILNAEAQASRLPDFVVFADPRSLGVFRDALSDAAAGSCVAEAPLDLAHATISDIERHVAALTPLD